MPVDVAMPMENFFMLGVCGGAMIVTAALLRIGPTFAQARAATITGNPAKDRPNFEETRL